MINIKKQISRILLSACMLFMIAPVRVQAAEVVAFSPENKIIYQSNGSVKINQENFTDNIFRTYVKKFDKNLDGILSSSELSAVKEIDVSNAGIRSLEGIALFTNLTELDCSENNLTSLNLSKNTKLTELDCSKNNLTTLNISKNTKLTELDCSENKLASLNVSKNTKLKELDCSENSLTSLNVSNNTKLKELDCHDNKLTSLDVSKNTKLEELDCRSNKLTKLDLSKNDKLKSKDLECDSDVTIKR